MKETTICGAIYLHLQELLMLRALGRGEVELWESEWLTDAVADMGVEEESHSSCSQVPISVVAPVRCVDLWVCPQVSHTLDVHHNHLVAGLLKREVAEGLR